MNTNRLALQFWGNSKRILETTLGVPKLHVGEFLSSVELPTWAIEKYIEIL